MNHILKSLYRVTRAPELWRQETYQDVFLDYVQGCPQERVWGQLGVGVATGSHITMQCCSDVLAPVGGGTGKKWHPLHPWEDAGRRPIT